MDFARAFTALQWLGLAEYELLLFAAVWFALGSLGEIAIDVLWMWLRLTGRVHTPQAAVNGAAPLRGVAAVFVPAWQEASVVGAMLEHCLRAWPQADLRIYAGCYRNDVRTLAALVEVAGDPRLRIVVHGSDGPTTKADCLNRLYAALCDDERRGGFRARSVILHDAEDMVHPLALALLDAELDRADFVQLPVRPEPQAHSPWIAGHYADEFAESHAKAMVVRDWLGAGLPSAGVGCAFRRDTIERIAAFRGTALPFDPKSLTEDYELGLLVAEIGGTARFLRVRDGDGRLVATSEFFPAELVPAVRQKTRWLHGIAFQGWEHLGWRGGPVELWMRLRDRSGPFSAVVMTAAYGTLPLLAMLSAAHALGGYEPAPVGAALDWLLWVNAASLFWRMACRVVFTTREYGWLEGGRAIFRMPVANIIAIMAARRAVGAYLSNLRGGALRWDKTIHTLHPSSNHAGAATG